MEFKIIFFGIIVVISFCIYLFVKGKIIKSARIDNLYVSCRISKLYIYRSDGSPLGAYYYDQQVSSVVGICLGWRYRLRRESACKYRQCGT